MNMDVFEEVFKAFISFREYRVETPPTRKYVKKIVDQITIVKSNVETSRWDLTIEYTRRRFSTTIAYIIKGFDNPECSTLMFFPAGSRPVDAELVHDRYNRILRYLEKHFNTKINVEVISKRCRGGVEFYFRKGSDIYTFRDHKILICPEKRIYIDIPEESRIFLFSQHKELRPIKRKLREISGRRYEIENMLEKIRKMPEDIKKAVKDITTYDIYEIENKYKNLVSRVMLIISFFIRDDGVYALYDRDPFMVKKLIYDYAKELKEYERKLKEIMALIEIIK
jgi:hypothetical protein